MKITKRDGIRIKAFLQMRKEDLLTLKLLENELLNNRMSETQFDVEESGVNLSLDISDKILDLYDEELVYLLESINSEDVEEVATRPGVETIDLILEKLQK